MTQIPLSNATTFSDADLVQFRKVQQLAYDCAEAVAAEMHIGITERQVAARMEAWLLERGVDDWFHKPFAWFGSRTAFEGFIGFKHLGGFNPAFYSGSCRLQENMPFILDVAPSIKGYTADIGYCAVVGNNPLLDRMMDDLLEYRVLILQQVRERRPLAQISRAVDQLCAKHGYEPRHKAYPFETLAHRVERLPDDGKERHLSLMRFGMRNITELLHDRLRGGRDGWSPIWNSSVASEHVPTPGLWAVEPHLGFRGTGAKFEELLVVTDDDAFWLDDDNPHVRRWQARGLLTTAQAA